jgi:hypothetical protein
VIKYMYTDTAADDGARGLREGGGSSSRLPPPSSAPRTASITYKDAIKEALSRR